MPTSRVSVLVYVGVDLLKLLEMDQFRIVVAIFGWCGIRNACPGELNTPGAWSHNWGLCNVLTVHCAPLFLQEENAMHVCFDDSLPSSPEFISLGRDSDLCFAYLMKLASYSARFSLNGIISLPSAKMLEPSASRRKRAMAGLVESGLIETHEDSIKITCFLIQDIDLEALGCA